MTLTGHFQNGVIVLDEPANLPDGVKVRVEVATTQANGIHGQDEGTVTAPTRHRFQSIIGIAKDLPPDASERVDEVLYDRPCQ